jgi:hypothetical protein
MLGVAALTVPALADGPGPQYQHHYRHHYGYGYESESLGGCWIGTNGGRRWSFDCATPGALYYGEPDYYGPDYYGPDYYAGPSIGFSFGSNYRHHWHR